MKFLAVAMSMVFAMTGLYARTCPVVDVKQVDDYYEMEVNLNGDGLVFTSYDEYQVGDNVTVILSNQGTATVEDDIIIDVR